MHTNCHSFTVTICSLVKIKWIYCAFLPLFISVATAQKPPGIRYHLFS